MTAIQLLACAGMIVGVFLLLEMKPVEFTDSLFGFLLNPKRSLREDIRESSGRKKSGILRRELKEAQNILQMTGRGNRFSFICAVALALFCAGGSIAILLGNFFLAPVMAVGFLFLPFWYVKLTANHYKRDVSAELETALSVITTLNDEQGRRQTLIEQCRKPSPVLSSAITSPSRLTAVRAT